MLFHHLMNWLPRSLASVLLADFGGTTRTNATRITASNGANKLRTCGRSVVASAADEEVGADGAVVRRSGGIGRPERELPLFGVGRLCSGEVLKVADCVAP